MSEAEIEPRTARAVEAEVTRRLQERKSEHEGSGREREKEKEKEKENEAGSSGQPTKSPKRTRERELPPGLTPLLKHHKDLDDELQSRLAELERKVENGNRDARLVDVLSPIWRKKTGRALRCACAFAFAAVRPSPPDNVKLRERWILFVVHVFLCRVAAATRRRHLRGRGDEMELKAIYRLVHIQRALASEDDLLRLFLQR
ncbi:hypothetical protein B0H14DRAFT_3448870 [Mycena olivaceomarginata]|nr:hypothetical protein B0H14DRAFT_3448870 [Mycena olivaceomarginata]